MNDFIDILFDRLPGPDSHFVEVENSKGEGISIGKWVAREDGMWALRIDLTELMVNKQVLATYSPCCKMLRIGKCEPNIMHTGLCGAFHNDKLGPTVYLGEIGEYHE